MKAKQLALIIKNLGITYQEAADTIGYTKGGFSALVSRNSEVPPDVIKRLRPMLLHKIRDRRKKNQIVEEILQHYLN